MVFVRVINYIIFCAYFLQIIRTWIGSVKEDGNTFQGQAKNQTFSSEVKCFEPSDQSAVSSGRQQISWLNMLPPMVQLFPHTVQ